MLREIVIPWIRIAIASVCGGILFGFFVRAGVDQKRALEIVIPIVSVMILDVYIQIARSFWQREHRPNQITSNVITIVENK